MEYYIFNTEQEAINAENFISNIAGFPIVCNNAKTGLPEPNKQKVERWAVPRQRLDGKWCFQRVPADEINKVPQQVIDQFQTDHPHTIEEYSENWFLVDGIL